MFIGIDPSINTTGYAAVTNKGNLSDLREIRPNKSWNLTIKMDYLADDIKRLLEEASDKERIRMIVIEQPPDYIASYGGRKKSVISMLHLAFAFGVIFGVCSNVVGIRRIKCQLAPHKPKGCRRLVGMPTKLRAASIMVVKFRGQIENFVDNPSPKNAKIYNMTDALYLAWAEWDLMERAKKVRSL